MLFWGGGEGGDAAVVIELARASKQRGIQCTVVAYAMTHPDTFQIKAETAGLAFNEDYFLVDDPGDLWAQTRLNREHFDLIHVHHGRAVPKRSDIVPLKKAAGPLPLILTAHGAPPLSSIVYGGLKSKISRLISPVWFECVVVPSEAKLREWRKMTPLSHNVIAIPNIVRFLSPIDKLEARSALGLHENTEVVLFCSRLEDEKDPLTFIRAVKETSRTHPNVIGLMAGGGSLAEKCESLVKELDAPIRLLGYVEDIGSLYSAADVFVQPSVYESFCITLLHAAEMGLPCVASDLEVFRDYYNEFESFRWFKPGDVAGCAEAIGHQLSDAPSTEAQELLRDRFSEESVVEAHRKLWQWVWNKKWEKILH